MMKMMKRIKLALLISALIGLTACATRHKQDDVAINDANAAYNAEASGLGDESGFGEEVLSRRSLSNRTYYFDFDSDVLHEQDRPAILRNADYLVAHPNAKVILEGHTDPRGSREYNIGLGERRAKTVANVLAAQGVNRSQIRIVSYGAEKLASRGRTEADYQLDRRVILVYLR